MASTPKESCRNTTRRRNVNKKSTMKIEIIRSDEDSDRTVVWSLYIDGVEMYQEVAKSLAVGTLDHSAKRITEATECCFKALRDDGFYVETDHVFVSKIQHYIDEELKRQQ